MAVVVSLSLGLRSRGFGARVQTSVPYLVTCHISSNVDDEGEAPGSSSIPGCFERCRDFRDLVFEDIDGPVLRCSQDAGEVGGVKPSLDHRVDIGGTRCGHVGYALGSKRSGVNR